MGIFAEKAIVGYHLSFVGQGKQSKVFCFRLQQQTEVCCLLFPITAKKWQLHFQLVPFFVCGILETWRQGDSGTWRHGDMGLETWKHGDLALGHETWKHEEMETWRHVETGIKF
jgi:hypothetical protein